MEITRETRLFFDASVLVSGSHSTQGGSALLLGACKAGAFRAQATSAVFSESLNALRRFPPQSLKRFYRLLVEVRWELLPVPRGDVLDRYLQFIDPKDVHVLAAAVEGRSEFLLTLDRRHILAAAESVRKADLPIILLRPGDLIREFYPQHRDYHDIPPSRT